MKGRIFIKSFSKKMNVNRRGALGEQAEVFMFLFLLIVIAIGITAPAYIFFGRGYDSRASDAGLLNGKIKECLNDNEIDYKLFTQFFEKCKLNENVLKDVNIIKICIDARDCVEDAGEFVMGSNFQSCFLEGAKGNKAYYKCDRESFLKSGKRIEIITGSIRNSREVSG